jgi:hypothetical protein
VTRIAVPSDAVRAASSTGNVALWQPVPGVVVHVVSDFLSLPLSAAIADFFRPVVERRRGVLSFADFREASGYSREAREHLADFTREHLPSFAAINILLGPQILSMGIGLYRLAVGDLVHTFVDEENFLRDLDAAVRGP